MTRASGGRRGAGVKRRRDRVSEPSRAASGRCPLDLWAPPAPFSGAGVSACPSFVPVDARRAEGGDGAAAGGSAPGRSAVGLLPEEARKFNIMTPDNSIYPD